MPKIFDVKIPLTEPDIYFVLCSFFYTVNRFEKDNFPFVCHVGFRCDRYLLKLNPPDIY